MAVNTGKVVVGGLASGFVMNVLGFLLYGMWLGPKFNAEMDAAMPGASAKMATGSAIAVSVVSWFIVGVLVVWLYAAMRPRFGAGFKTAAYAALAVWLCGFLFYLPQWQLGLMTTMTYTMATVVSLVVLMAGGYVGGMLYKEEG